MSAMLGPPGYADDVLTFQPGEQLVDFDAVLSATLGDADIDWEMLALDAGCSAVSQHTAVCTTSGNC